MKVYWDDDNNEIEALSFPVYIFAKTIDQLGGAVFPKLNCSSPQVINSYSFVMKCYWLLLQDATWVAMGNTLKCTWPSDVFLFLKSSDFMMHGLSRV